MTGAPVTESDDPAPVPATAATDDVGSPISDPATVPEPPVSETPDIDTSTPTEDPGVATAETTFVDDRTLSFDPTSDTCDALTATLHEAPLLGGDYQRAHVLPNGDVLWLFQDVFVATDLGPRLVHNAGLVQRAGGSELLITDGGDGPSSYLFADRTVRFEHWYWPLDGVIAADGLLYVFVAEVVEHGSSYLSFVEPVATWIVAIDPDTLAVVQRGPAPDPSSSLYGWSVVSAGEYTYLYAHCHRQFGWDEVWFAPGMLTHDRGCTADVTVARVPRGTFDARPEYWDGAGWNPDPETAVPVIPTDERAINPTQVAVLDGVFVAVTKVGDWWGHDLVLDVAPNPEGPWETYATVPVTPPCDHCSTYFASIVPFGADDVSFVVALSCNDWNGAELEHYLPMFVRVPRPDAPDTQVPQKVR